MSLPLETLHLDDDVFGIITCDLAQTHDEVRDEAVQCAWEDVTATAADPAAYG